MKKFAFPKMAISLPLAILAVAILLFINETSYHESRAAIESFEQAQRTRGSVNKLLQNLLDAETGQRGYLLTGDPSYLDPYNSSMNDINQNLDELQRLLGASEADQTEFATLSRHISRKLAEMDLSIRMRKEDKDEAWKFVLTTDVGREHMMVIRAQSAKLISSSNQRMEVGQIKIHDSLLLSRIGVPLVALSGLLAFYLYLRQTRALVNSGLREQEALKRERDQLDLQVSERTARLAELATHLQNVREDERGHLARELHDELGALLTAAKLDVARLKSRLGTHLPETTERLAHLTETLNTGIALKRRIVEDLRPSSLSHLGLVASLEILAREFEDRSGLQITTDLENVNLGGSAQLTVDRLVQESLTNIGKYAQASQVKITLQNLKGYVQVEVHDDGKGFDLHAVSASNHGLVGMRHRVEAGGGRLTIRSAPDKGTQISAVLPD